MSTSVKTRVGQAVPSSLPERDSMDSEGTSGSQQSAGGALKSSGLRLGPRLPKVAVGPGSGSGRSRSLLGAGNHLLTPSTTCTAGSRELRRGPEMSQLSPEAHNKARPKQ